MKHFVSAFAIAIVCARGVYRAGCVGPRGAVGVHRYGYGYHRYGYGYHRTVVVRRRVY
jgi:hypothetical protein